MATGTYTGDGAVSQSITGLGFMPRLLIVTAHLAVQTVGENHLCCIVYENMASDIVITNRLQDAYDNCIPSLDSDGFTVDDDGGDLHPNKNGQQYDYVAFG